jgi:lambda repressor-like predicted transcriptional regulator
MRTRDRIIELHKQGLSNAEIGRAVGVSRQRVWDVLHPKEKKRRYDISAVLSAPKNALISPMRISSVAAFLGVHPNTIRRWSDNGLIQCFRLGPRHDRRFQLQHVMEAIRPRID